MASLRSAFFALSDGGKHGLLLLQREQTSSAAKGSRSISKPAWLFSIAPLAAHRYRNAESLPSLLSLFYVWLQLGFWDLGKREVGMWGVGGV